MGLRAGIFGRGNGWDVDSGLEWGIFRPPEAPRPCARPRPCPPPHEWHLSTPLTQGWQGLTELRTAPCCWLSSATQARPQPQDSDQRRRPTPAPPPAQPKPCALPGTAAPERTRVQERTCATGPEGCTSARARPGSLSARNPPASFVGRHGPAVPAISWRSAVRLSEQTWSGQRVPSQGPQKRYRWVGCLRLDLGTRISDAHLRVNAPRTVQRRFSVYMVIDD